MKANRRRHLWALLGVGLYLILCGPATVGGAVVVAGGSACYTKDSPGDECILEGSSEEFDEIICETSNGQEATLCDLLTEEYQSDHDGCYEARVVDSFEENRGDRCCYMIEVGTDDDCSSSATESGAGCGSPSKGSSIDHI